MKRLLFYVMMLTVSVSMSAQSLSISGFRLLETDLTAITQGTQEIDQNGEVAALIKIVTGEVGFTFDIGMLGVVGTKQAVGEIWVYVPKRTQKISIFHQQYGVIRNYFFPIPIESGRTYEMKVNVEKEQPKIEIAAAIANDYENAYRTYKLLAETGDASAQFYVGYALSNGLGVAQNYTEAIEWYKKAAQQGDARAQCNLGICYENGNGVDKDLVQASYWYKMSSEQNNMTAQYNLGDCYYNGKGTKQNIKKAFNCFMEAAKQNHIEAQYMVGKILYFDLHELPVVYGDDVLQRRLGKKERYQKAVSFFEKAAEKGHVQAQISLANCYIEGKGVEKNIQEAVRWLRKAKELGPLDAQWEDIIKAYEERQ